MTQARIVDVKTIPIAQVAHRMQNAEEHAKRRVHDKVYGNTSRRQAIARLRENSADRGPASPPVVEPQRCCALGDILVNQAVEIHEKHKQGTLQASRPKIASDSHNVSLIKLDVEKIGLSPEAAKETTWKKSEMSDGTAFGQVPYDDPRTSKIHNDTDKAMKSDVNKIRGYLDLLDEYSLHHFVIWQGKVIRDTPEFTSLTRTHQAAWSSIDRCVSILEEIMTVNAIPLAVIDGKQLGELARFDLERVDEADLCSAIANLEQIRPLLHHTRLIPNGPSAAQLAAVTIQANVRRFLERSGFLLLQRRRDSAVKLQCLVRGERARRLVGTLLLERKRQVHLRWQELQDGLRGKWDTWRKSERVMILLPLATTDKYGPNLQISHMHWLVDPKVHVVCVLPSQPDEVVLEYNRKVLEMSGVYNTRGRMTVVVPENVDLFHNRLAVASILLYSPGCLKRINRIVKGKPAIIISDEASWQDKRLAVALGAPLLSADPSVALLLRTQSGMKRIFAAADVSAPIGAHDVYDEEDLMVALTKLIACNLDVRRWFIKVDVCRGNRGLAVLDTFSLSCMEGLKREKAQLGRANSGASGVWHHPDVQLLARARLLKTLRRCLHRVVSVCDSGAYPTWALFLGHLARVGGVIEAEAPEKQRHPSCSVFISPTGNITCLAETEMLFDACYQQVGCVHPQECVSLHALRGASVAISRGLRARGVMGYVSIHFVVFWDEQADAMRLWATGLELGLSVSAFSFCFFRSLTRRPGGNRETFNFGCYEEPADGNDTEQK
ncbi:unnamed protein product, partial [Pylaiella littoralis]